MAGVVSQAFLLQRGQAGDLQGAFPDLLRTNATLLLVGAEQESRCGDEGKEYQQEHEPKGDE